MLFSRFWGWRLEPQLSGTRRHAIWSSVHEAAHRDHGRKLLRLLAWVRCSLVWSWHRVVFCFCSCFPRPKRSLDSWPRHMQAALQDAIGGSTYSFAARPLCKIQERHTVSDVQVPSGPGADFDVRFLLLILKDVQLGFLVVAEYTLG